MIDVLSYFVSWQFVESLFIIIILGFFLKAINRYLIKREKTNPKSERKKSTTIGIVLSTLRYIAVLSAVFIILSINGIDPTGIFAGLGIVATIVGLALQDTLKDILSGINIYNNNFYKVGDVVEYDGKTCEVKFFNARVTKFRDMFTNATYTVCNSTINKATKIKDYHLCLMLIEFGTTEDKLNKAFTALSAELKKIEGIEAINGFGILNFTERGMQYAISYKMDPKLQFENYFKIMSTVHNTLQREGIAVIDYERRKNIV